MHNRFTRFAAGATAALALFGAASMALPASASSLTQTQISAIVGLLQSFGADQSVIANVSAALGAQTPPPTGGYSPTNCLSLSRNLSVGLQGDDVTGLQNFLMTQGDLASGNNTGYFGLMTQAAVMQWQTAHGISAVGSVGPQTRAAMGCNQSGTSVAPTTQTSGIPSATIDQNPLTGSPTSGVVPLDVSFSGWTPIGQDTINFGDGSYDAGVNSAACNTRGACGLDHTYNAPGTYIATEVAAGEGVISKITITVTGSSTTGTY